MLKEDPAKRADTRREGYRGKAFRRKGRLCKGVQTSVRARDRWMIGFGNNRREGGRAEAIARLVEGAKNLSWLRERKGRERV